MPRRDGGKNADAVAEVVAQIGMDNVEAVHEVYRRFAAKVDYRALMDWSIKQPLDDLLMPLFLAAVVTITRELDLGEVGRLLAESLAAADGNCEWQWAARVVGPHGTRFDTMPGEEAAREYCAGVDSPRYTYTVVRRRIGPWTQAPSV